MMQLNQSKLEASEEWLRREREDLIRDGLFVCYECKDDRCGYCIGIPCMCECTIPQTEPEYSI